MNAVYSKDIFRKICSALSVKQQNGEFIGSWAPYGYKKCADDYHRLEPDAETAPVVRQIFQMRCAGAGYQMIVRSLIREGIPSPSQYHYLKGDTKAERCANAKWHVPMVQKYSKMKCIWDTWCRAAAVRSLAKRGESAWFQLMNGLLSATRMKR